eukprot:TRINITY_DN5524_c0_g1_i5.p1 TRINITY_DN5524_c0_g1~~TRINITY_DN5524_c0_g1_i5.p1  ORF type:complete len:107 (+),score=16.76 TRINITY_DN5524_c0_g1_i5:245-565(+)
MSSVRRFISKVKVSFGAYDKAARGSREFLRQWSAAKVAASAPDLEVLSEVRTDGGPPTVVVKYTDGHEAVLDVSNSDVRNIVKEVEDHALSLGNVETVKAWQLKSS